MKHATQAVITVLSGRRLRNSPSAVARSSVPGSGSLPATGPAAQ